MPEHLVFGNSGVIIGKYSSSCLNKPDSGGGLVLAWQYSSTNLQVRVFTNGGGVYKRSYGDSAWGLL